MALLRGLLSTRLAESDKVLENINHHHCAVTADCLPCCAWIISRSSIASTNMVYMLVQKTTLRQEDRGRYGQH